MPSLSPKRNKVIENLVSTIIPVYNRPALLSRAVKSVLEQTHRAFEIIIVDDGSTDDTPEVARALVRQYPDYITFISKNNTGPGPTREVGRQAARGEFIQYLDSDDRLLPDKFEAQIRVLRLHPDCGIAYGYTRLMDDENGQQLSAPFKWTGRDIPFLFPGLLVDRWWCTHTPLYRRTVTDAIGPWCDFRWSQDWEYDAKAGAMGVRLVNCHQYVSEHHHHSGVRQTAQADWTHDPERLRNRVALLSALWSNAEQAQVAADSPESQHFSRWAFAIARQCAAAALLSESRTCLALAETVASPSSVSRRGLKPYRLLSQMIGYRTTGRLFQILTQLKPSTSSATLPQSFSV